MSMFKQFLFCKNIIIKCNIEYLPTTLFYIHTYILTCAIEPNRYHVINIIGNIYHVFS